MLHIWSLFDWIGLHVDIKHKEFTGKKKWKIVYCKLMYVLLHYGAEFCVAFKKDYDCCDGTTEIGRKGVGLPLKYRPITYLARCVVGVASDVG